MKSHYLSALTLAVSFAILPAAMADDYVIDTKGAHAFIQFRIKHLGYSWLLGRFNQFEGSFSYDQAKPESSSVEVTIKTASIDSNHAERDKHLRGADFLDVRKYPEARFVSSAYQPTGDNTAQLTGTLTLHGVSRPVSIEVQNIGHGPDPWGGYRRGFQGTAKLTLADFNINYDLGPAAREIELFLSVEGVRR